MSDLGMEGRSAIVFGVANKRSIAWGITRRLHEAGAKLTLAYQGERFLSNLEKLTAEAGIEDALFVPCDVTEEGAVDEVFGRHGERWGGLDGVVHSVAFAPREALEGEFTATTRDAFRTALEVSSYSLLPMADRAKEMMAGKGGAILALTYLASQRVVANYNVMGTAKAALEHMVRQLSWELGPAGIRVNAVSAGPLQTLSARGVSGFTDVLKIYEDRAPLKRNVTLEEVADASLFLLSDASTAITGQVLYVDCGFSIVAF